MSIVKVCKIHGNLTEEKTLKEKNSNLKLGYQIRCLECRRDKDRRWKYDNRDIHRASASRARNEERRLYREGLIDTEPKANIWAKEDRKKKPELYAAASKRARDKLGKERNVIEICRRLNVGAHFFHDLMKSQNGICAICKKEETKKSRSGGICSLSIDHNHTTGKVRSLLCHHCNAGIGHFCEDIKLLQSAIDYLKSHECVI